MRLSFRTVLYGLAFGALALKVALHSWPVERAGRNGHPLIGALYPGMPETVGWVLYPPVEEIQPAPGGGVLATVALHGTAEKVLADLAQRLGPRAERVAGAPDKGRMTWLVHSPVMGFPDWVTADASALPLVGGEVQLVLWSRPALPLPDWGRNQNRLTGWIADLRGSGDR
ncbi:hypothetical protein [Neotabrizicola sp. VNH66]|uniref:hypothetical protein n=1 Tax=Neotabrizicola sp. VNH66 TaxID=3400918 RepID=UPI003C0C3FAC